MKLILCIVSLLLLISACVSQGYPPEVEESLVLAGDNRVELEKVLTYFKNKGKVPYRSACFLIGNMKYHESESAYELDSAYHVYFARVDSAFKVIFHMKQWIDIMNYNNPDHDSLRFSFGNTYNNIAEPKLLRKHILDLQSVNADFLIDNIESALYVWKERGYKDKDFDFFKEFILPYRTGDEQLTFKRSVIRRMYSGIIADSCSSIANDIIDRYRIYSHKMRWLSKYAHASEHLNVYDPLIPPVQSSCPELAYWSSNILRACGVPAICEFTTKWKERDSKHYWCTSPDDKTGILLPYTAPYNNLKGDWDSDIKYAGKVFRKNFGAQRNSPCFIANADEFIPQKFQSPLLSDQTFRYHQTVTVRIPFTTHTYNKLAYLCLFSASKEKVPVGWGIIDLDKKEIVFEQVPLNTLFFPVCYDGDVMLDIAEPFMIYASEVFKDIAEPLTINDCFSRVVDLSVRNGKLVYTDGKKKQLLGLTYVCLSCDTVHKTTLHLLRKYPEKRLIRNSLKLQKGLCVLGTHSETEKYDTIYIHKEPHVPYLQEIVLGNSQKYRYYRFATLSRSSLDLAHIEFLGSYSAAHYCSKPTPLPLFSKEQSTERKKDSLYRISGFSLHGNDQPELAFDNDFNTFTSSRFVEVDFQTPVSISRIRFLPRNANNMIVSGDSYMLMYYDNGWKEYDILYAEHQFLDFEHVPRATLYWLRNLTEGKEELPFFYMDGKQYFMHTDTIPILK